MNLTIISLFEKVSRPNPQDEANCSISVICPYPITLLLLLIIVVKCCVPIFSILLSIATQSCYVALAQLTKTQ